MSRSVTVFICVDVVQRRNVRGKPWFHHVNKVNRKIQEHDQIVFLPRHNKMCPVQHVHNYCFTTSMMQELLELFRKTGRYFKLLNNQTDV